MARLRRLDISDRLSSIKYRTSYYDLGVTMDQGKAEEVFGTLTTKANKDIAAAPHAYVSYSGTLHGVSPYRSFTGGTATFKSVSGIDQFDFLTPFAGTAQARSTPTSSGTRRPVGLPGELHGSGHRGPGGHSSPGGGPCGHQSATQGLLRVSPEGHRELRSHPGRRALCHHRHGQPGRGSLAAPSSNAPLPPYTTLVSSVARPGLSSGRGDPGHRSHRRSITTWKSRAPSRAESSWPGPARAPTISRLRLLHPAGDALRRVLRHDRAEQLARHARGRAPGFCRRHRSGREALHAAPGGRAGRAISSGRLWTSILTGATSWAAAK